MDRVQDILRKLEALYLDKRPKSGIDLDLMLDYTRVLYADLLEWRRSFPQTEGAVAGKMPVAAVQREAPGEIGTAKPQREDMPDSAETEAPSNGLPSPEVVKGRPTPVNKMQAPDEKVREKGADNIAEAHENNEASFIHDRRPISFEPPTPTEEVTVAIQDGLEEEMPQELSKPDFFLEQKEETAPVFSKITDLKNNAAGKDIRKEIGINDRYLYLNELFGNRKQEYEAALARLNELNSLEEAKQYVNTEIASLHQWDKEEETVQDFYALLQKHFTGG